MNSIGNHNQVVIFVTLVAVDGYFNEIYIRSSCICRVSKVVGFSSSISRICMENSISVA
jgi:hypothetical protein